MIIKIIIMKKEKKYYTNEGTNRKQEVQINEEETGKLPENEFISKRNAVILILWKLSGKFFSAKYSLFI